MVNKTPSRRRVYGLALLGRFNAIKIREGRDGLAEVIREMREEGYRGPIHMGDVNKTKKYLLSDYILCLDTYRGLYGRKELDQMSLKVPMLREVFSWFDMHLKKPGSLIKKSDEYWHEFFDFGEFIGTTIGGKEGEITGKGVCIGDKIFCRSITKYIEGAGKLIGSDVKSRHIKCKLRGDNISKWKIKW